MLLVINLSDTFLDSIKIFYSLIFNFFFFFLHVHARVEGEGIRTCDLRFIRRGSQTIELPLGDKVFHIQCIFLTYIYN
jgi:hypothetical protein